MKRLTKLWPVRLGMDVLDTYSRCSIAQSAAALAYFLILTLVPLLMCVNYFIGLFHLDLEQMLLGLRQVFPQEGLQVILDYLSYAAENRSPAVLAAALSTIVISASAGLRTLLHTMDRLYHREPGRGVRRMAVSVVLSLLLLLTIYLSILVIFTGDWFFQLLEEHLPGQVKALILLPALSQLWLWLRY
ncbi:MAG: YhjD/YihY/BrkB family envelope integrity protein, partial [Firmicutes bacterium]|nr:YhjD/YihY/BrkB family envelope integrity protein [Bacillota bacterium]